MGRNEDRAAARRAKRRGENPSDADAPEPTGAVPSEGTPEDPATGQVGETQRAEKESRQGVVGSPVDFDPEASPAPGQSDFEPAPGGEVVGGEVTRTGGPRVLRFFRASWAELQRVRWPDRQQVAQGTAVTLGFVVIAGAYLGLADVGARALVNLILGT